jgi:protein-tyrosine phosphatase
LPFDVRPVYLDDLVFQMQLAGYTVILAHPERYRFVQQDLPSVGPLVDRGVMLQATAPALLGEYGPTVKRTAERLLQRGFYALAASDRHHPGPLRSLATMHSRVAALMNVDLADLLLCENPRRVLDGQSVIPPDRMDIPARKGFFDRFRSRTL